MVLANGAGALRDLVAFEKRTEQDDLHGNTRGEFENQFSAAACIQARFGGESVTAARLEGRQPATITVRFSSNTRQVTTEWRLRDERTGTVYNIRSIDDRDKRHQWIDILCESGVAT